SARTATVTSACAALMMRVLVTVTPGVSAVTSAPIAKFSPRSRSTLRDEPVVTVGGDTLWMMGAGSVVSAVTTTVTGTLTAPPVELPTRVPVYEPGANPADAENPNATCGYGGRTVCAAPVVIPAGKPVNE